MWDGRRGQLVKFLFEEFIVVPLATKDGDDGTDHGDEDEQGHETFHQDVTSLGQGIRTRRHND
ncbi:MAG: hypothetical protein Kow0010_11550 [Dehalococcoidia bacterium]